MLDPGTALEGRRRLHAIDAVHPPSSSPGLFTRVGVRRIEAIVRAVDPADDMARVRLRLRWFRVATFIRVIGWLAGALLALSAAELVLAIITIVVSDSVVRWWFDPLVFTVLWSLLFWLLLWVGVGAIAPSTKLSRRVREFEGLSSAGRRGLSRKSTIFTIEAAGAIARTFYRVVTGRTFTRTRPDLAAEVGALSLSLMIAIPTGGPDMLRRRAGAVAEYNEFLRDVIGLLVAQRLDIVPILQQNLTPGTLVTRSAYDEMHLYLQPFGRRTTAEALKDYALPAAAFVVSVLALAVSLTKP